MMEVSEKQIRCQLKPGTMLICTSCVGPLYEVGELYIIEPYEGWGGCVRLAKYIDAKRYTGHGATWKLAKELKEEDFL